MKILISAQSYPTSKVQLAAFIAVLAEEMTRQGVEVTVIAPQSLSLCLKHRIPLVAQKYTVDIMTNNGYKQITVMRPWSISLGQGKFYKITQKIDKFVINRAARKIKNKPDVVYSHFWWSAENILDYAEKNNIPSFVATGEDAIDIHKILDSKRIEKIALSTKGVICVSSKNRDESISCGLTDGNNCIVLPNAINQEEFKPVDKFYARQQLGYDKGDFIVAFCGRFNERKGCGRVSDAIKQINDKRVKSIFIGNPAGSSFVEPDCPGILFKGRLPHKDIPLYLNCADVFVLPTLAEGCSNSIVEAMACGLPIISSDLSFNYDILDSSNAILIDPLSVEDIKNAILLIKNNKNLGTQLSKASLIKASKLTIEKRTTEILNFINSKM